MSLILNLQTKIKSKEHTAAVIGLGYVGLPLIQTICSQNINAIGIDIDSKKITSIKNGKSYIDGVSDENIQKFQELGLLQVSCDFSILKKADVIILCVPTPLDEDAKPDLSFIINTTEEIAQNLNNAGQMIVLESTTYPGTVEDIMEPILKSQASEESYFLAYSPEREDPGNQNFSTSSTPKIVGADTPEILQTAELFYKQFINNVVCVPSIKIAEAAKITENIFRAVNIALVNELKLIFDKMDIDVWDIIDAASTKPFGYMPFYPGPGIGGHCIPIDPIYLSWKARQVGQETEFIELASKINQSMTDYICDKLHDSLKENGIKELVNSNVMLIGVAYKKNVKDQRESPAFPLIRMLKEKGCNVSFHDTYIPAILPSRQFQELTALESMPLTKENIKSQDAAIIITDHDDVDFGLLAEHASLVIDTRNAIEKRKLKCLGRLVKA